MSSPAASGPTRAEVSPIRRFDRVLFALEDGMIAAFLVAITVLVFLEVVMRQLEAPESRVGRWIAGALSITDEATRSTLDHAVAPIVIGVVGWALFSFGAAHAERVRERAFFGFRGSPLAMGAIVLAGVAAIAALMLSVESRWVYVVLLAASGAAFVVRELRDKAVGWQRRLGVGVLSLGVLIAVAVFLVPRGYLWSKEISMLCVLWVGLFGASVCVPIGKHIRVETFDKAIPAHLQRWFRAAGYLATAIFCAYLAYLGYRYELDSTSTGEVLPMTRIPYWFQSLALPIAFGITTLRFVGAAFSAAQGGEYGAPAKAEGQEEAEKLAAEREAEAGATTASGEPAAGTAKPKRPVTLLVAIAAIVLLPFLGKGGILASAILVTMVLGLPIFVVLGVVVVACFLLWTPQTNPFELTIMNRIADLADNQALLAIPFFVMSGAVMSRGEISKKLVRFSMALVGWLPGGLAVSAVLACMIFAAISGSSPATVVAIGGMMAPALIKEGYKPLFSHGLVTSAGSLGILIPPSIPMIVYAIVNTRAGIEVERLFACGYGPGLVIGGILMTMGVAVGIRDKTPRQPFSLSTLANETRDGFWALMFPVAISLGIYSGVFNAIESACFSVVYAVIVEVYVHRAMKLSDVPKTFQETGIMLGSFLVILVIATSFGEFLNEKNIPALAAQWVEDMHLTQWQFLLVVNALLLVVGCLLDIMSAIFIFVPLLAPMALAAGVDPLHFGIIFIVNLEIGYLTPPVGLNLFIGSTLFGKSVGYMVRAVMPFVAVMLVGLLVITFSDRFTVGVADLLMGPPAARVGGSIGETGEVGELEDEEDDGAETPAARPACDPPEDLDCDGNVTIEEITEYADRPQAAAPTPPSCQPPEDLNCDGNVTIEEITEYTERQLEAEGAAPNPAPAPPPAPAPQPSTAPAP